MAFDTFTQLSLASRSEQLLLQRVLENSGFEYSGPRSMLGMSGLEHDVDAIGMRGGNLALVFSGPKDLGLRSQGDIHSASPKFLSEVWCRDALLRMYDVSSGLERQGIRVDFVLFENQLTTASLSEGIVGKDELPGGFNVPALKAWIAHNKLPDDWRGNTQFSTMSPIERASQRYLSSAAESSGACYFGLNDLTLNEVSAICGTEEITSRSATQRAMQRLRVDQYFNPPADELILSALALSPRSDSRLVEQIHTVAVELAHRPVQNVIVPGTNYQDPVATAKSLADIGAIEYSAEVILRESGREIVHRVTKTAQENFVIRALRVVDLPGIVRGVMEGLRR